VSELELELTLTIEEVNAILGVLGDLPTKVGAWPLVAKIKTQAEEQLPKPEEAVGGTD
jgi:hypothetical protein